MIEQYSVLKLLNENPVTETAPWIAGEPSVEELLRDPVMRALLRRDGLSAQDLMGAIARGRGRLAAAPAVSAASAAPIPMTPAAAEPLGGEVHASDAA